MKHKPLNLNDLFGEVVFVYGEDQAIEDGLLLHPYPDEWPWALVTRGVYDACEDEAQERNLPLDHVLRALMVEAIQASVEMIELDPRTDLVELEGTAAGTVYVRPNGQGGLTILQPHED